NAQHGAHAGIVERGTQALELRDLRIVRLASRDARVLARLTGALAPHNDLVGTQIEQQRFGTFLDQAAPAQREARDQLAAPPTEIARQRRLGQTRPETSQLSFENGIHGTKEVPPPRPRRITNGRPAELTPPMRMVASRTVLAPF